MTALPRRLLLGRPRPAAAGALGTLAACLAGTSWARAATPPEPPPPVASAPLAPAPSGTPTATVASEPTAPPTATIAVEPTAPAPTAVVARAPYRSPPPPSVEKERVFYGWLNMLVGEACIAGALGAAYAGVPEAGIIGIGYLAGGPIIHAVYGEATHAWASLGLNVGLPVVGMLSGLAVGEALDSMVGTRIAVGALTGFVTAPILDGIALGWTYEPVEEEEPDDTAKLIVLPHVDFEGGYRGIDVAVRF